MPFFPRKLTLQVTVNAEGAQTVGPVFFKYADSRENAIKDLELLRGAKVVRARRRDGVVASRAAAECSDIPTDSHTWQLAWTRALHVPAVSFVDERYQPPQYWGTLTLGDLSIAKLDDRRFANLDPKLDGPDSVCPQRNLIDAIVCQGAVELDIEIATGHTESLLFDLSLQRA